MSTASILQSGRLACIVALCFVTIAAAQPRVTDERLKIELIAEHPNIVTPTGLTVDARGRVFVIESHTHFPPEGYTGPATDRIRLITDSNGDGVPDAITTFFEGTRHTMNIAAYHDGSLFVATRREIFRLRDTDDDGKADERTTIATLDTPGDYPHNGLSGFAFDFDGSVTFGFGENLGADYKLIGSDGTTLSGGGEGGNIYSCDSDGRKLRRVATGFWNPFHLGFDAFGRLFAVDNDPDSRPPCRLLHIVEGGDYGYRFRNGRKGLHPFTSWDGEVPGTLPMVAGTAEAPSGIVAYESDLLPEEYRGTLLGTSWGDHRIERFRLKSRGASFESMAEPIVVGDANFRPVGIVLAPDGSLYVSDWVDQSYKVHGKGRVWRVSATRAADAQATARPAPDDDPRKSLASVDGATRLAAARALVGQGNLGRQLLRQRAMSDDDPRVRAVAIAALSQTGDMDPALKRSAIEDKSEDVRQLAARLLPDDAADWAALVKSDMSAQVRAAALRRIKLQAGAGDDLATVMAVLTDDDPFLRQAARGALERSPQVLMAIDPTTLADARQQLGVLLALRATGGDAAAAHLGELLKSSHEDVRFAVVQWIGEVRLKEHYQALRASLEDPAITPRLFAATMAAMDLIDGRPATQSDGAGGGVFFFSRIVGDDKAPVLLLRIALRSLPPDHPSLTLDRLRKLASSDDAAVALEAIRSLRDCPHKGAAEVLASIARDASRSVQHRAEAAMGLRSEDDAARGLLLDLATGENAMLRDESLRALRGAQLSGDERKRLIDIKSEDVNVQALIARVLDPSRIGDRPSHDDLTAWSTLLAGKADAAVGERIFFHPRGAGCYRCHTIAGRGGAVGPDLSLLARATDHAKVVESLLKPANQIAPRWQAWRVELADGRELLLSFVGLQPREGYIYSDTAGTLYPLKDSDIVSKTAVPVSIMPEGLTDAMTLQELRDLVAFLATLK